MPSWVSGPDGEAAWKKAKEIVKEQYGAGLEKSDPDRFYSLVTTIYKSVCKSPDYDCGIGEAAKPGTMGVLIEEKITQEWIKGVRKWWLQWKKDEDKYLPDKGQGEYTKKDLCDAYKFMSEGITRLRRLRDNLLYVQGFWPYRGEGKKTKDPKIMSGSYALMDKEGQIATYEIRNFQARFIYKLDDIENMLWGWADKFATACNDWDKSAPGEEGSLADLRWYITFDITRQKLTRADRVLKDEIFNRLKRLEKDVFEPMQKAQAEFAKDDVKVAGFHETLPEAKIGNVTLVLDTLPIELEPAKAIKGKSEVQRSPKQLQQYVKEAIKAQRMLQKKGLGKLWYGTIIVKGKEKGKRRTADAGAKGWLGGAKGKDWQAAASYSAGPDIINIFSGPRDFLWGGVAAQDLLHELAHRYWHRFMSAAQRRQWEQNFNKAEFATDYASRNASEEFAENFSFYLLDRLKGPHVERMRSVMRESTDPKNELQVLAEQLSVFCEGVSSKKLREAEQMKGWHEQDAKYLRGESKKQSGAEAKATLMAAESHEKAAEAFAVALASQSAKDLKKAKEARKEALLATRNR